MKIETQNSSGSRSIAIIGMACFFPKSLGLKSYWRLLVNGEDAITDIPETHWSPEDYFDENPNTPDHVYCKRGGFLTPIPFDPTEFGIPPNILDATDTSQIIALMAAKKALEDSGYGNGKPFDRSRTSVILGATGAQELAIDLGARLGHPKWRKALEAAGVPAEQAEAVIQRISAAYPAWQENSFPGLLGNVVAGRICNRLDLGGTNCVVDAACASSMSAIHLAALELLSYKSDMVVTGGVDTLNDIFMHMCFSRTSVLSRTGDARPFSKYADGTVLGEGVGILVLKRLPDAEKDGDKIYAVIKAIGASSDGKSQSIYAPGSEGQARALISAYREAGATPSTIELIEAHGTGTRVGDRVELQALTRVFSDSTDRENGSGPWCGIGSVKSMIGHTKAAAGAAGLIKSALALLHKVMPPTLKAAEADPDLDITETPFYLNTHPRPWFSKTKHPRRSGVSAFGFGGSNFHVVLEEYARGKPGVAWDGAVEIVALSAADKKGLFEQVREAAGLPGKGNPLRDVPAMAAKTRQRFSAKDPYRILFVLEHPFHEAAELFSVASGFLAGANSTPGRPESRTDPQIHKNIFYGSPDLSAGGKPGKLAYLFPGQGSQYVGMATGLVCTFGEAFDAMERANRFYNKSSRLSDYIYPVPSSDSQELALQEEALCQTRIAQPAIGAVSLGMLGVLDRFGVRPDAACGHSFGELTALHAAGRIDADTFLRLAVARGRFMANPGGEGRGGDRGGMLAVTAPLDKLEKMIENSGLNVVLANRNGPTQGVLSGPRTAIEQARKQCQKLGFNCRLLPVSAAFHSSLVADARGPFLDLLKTQPFRKTSVPVYANSTGTPYPDDPEGAKSILANQITNPVRFSEMIQNLFAAGVTTFLEVGPRRILSNLVNAILAQKPGDAAAPIRVLAMDASPGNRPGTGDLARTLCHLSAIGYGVDLDAWEESGVEPEKKKMSIPVCGANLKPSPGPSSEKPSVPAKTTVYAAKGSITRSAPPPAPIQNPVFETHLAPPSDKLTDRPEDEPIDNPDNPKITAMKTPTRSTEIVAHALQMTREGLKSMQELHRQTARAHTKFLETQTEAGRVLQEMMEHTQRLAQASFGLSPAVPEFRNNAAPPPDVSFEPTVGTVAAGVDAKAEAKPFPEETGQPQTKPAPADPPIPKRGKGRAEVENALITVVSRLTGYPEDMVDPHMDIEADLGIDSIKRVEILSALEEALPGLPPVSPDMLGTLKTLARVVDLLVQEGGAAENSTDAETRDPGADGGQPARGLDTIEQNLLAVVSRLTGYPEDMIDPNMDIEADLGIDSIKRVEILSALEEAMPGLPGISPEHLGVLKTLGQIAGFLSGSPENALPPGDGNACALSCGKGPFSCKTAQISKTETPEGESAGHPVETVQGLETIQRRIVSFREAPPRGAETVSLRNRGRVLVFDDGTGLSREIVEEFLSRGIDAALTPYPDRPGFFLELPNSSETAGLVIASPFRDPGASPGNAERFLKNAMLLAREAAPHLIRAGRAGGALFGVVTRLDGAFGLGGGELFEPVQGGLAALAKTASVEWENVCCRAVDVAPDWKENRTIAQAVVMELLTGDPEKSPAGSPNSFLEIGLSPGARVIPSLETAPHPEKVRIDIDIAPGEVVVLTGGGRGVAAAAAIALARQAKPTLVLFGRSPHPSPEPEWLEGLEGEAAIKKAIRDHEFPGAPPKPVDLERACKKHLANREISQTLEKIRQTGSTAIYFSVDVRRADEVVQALGSLRSNHGPIKCLIHAAGVLEDRLIVDKTPDQFDRVFDTKVKGLQALLDATAHDPLAYLVLFSSVSARFGNRGQADYAMANEAMNKIARNQALKRPNCRVVSIDWGPFDGGMVSPALAKEFRRRNIDLIPVESGALSLLREMSMGRGAPVEVLIGATIIEKRATDPVDLQKTAAIEKAPAQTGLMKNTPNTLSVKLQHEVDLERYPILKAHLLDGKPVVPFALMTEWLGHCALHENPGLFFHGLDDMRMLKGITLDRKSRLVRLFSGKPNKNGKFFEVEVEIRDGVKDEREVIHSRARAVLSYTAASPPDFDISTHPLDPGVKTYSRSVDEIYESVLFHGYPLRGILDILHCTETGMAARIACAPSPAQWISDPPRSRWIADPLVLDAAFQMAIVWCFENRGKVSLPSYSASYRQFAPRFPEEGVLALLDVTGVTEHRMTGNYTFLDSENRVVATLSGCESIMDHSLLEAFKRAEN